MDRALYEQTKNEIGNYSRTYFCINAIHIICSIVFIYFYSFPVASLIGDTNLFLSRDDNSESDQHLIGEAEIMIAEPVARNKGMGKESMLLMLKYGVTLGLEKFMVKIGYDNSKSQTMFEKFQFSETSRTAVFREITYERVIDSEWLLWLNSQVPFYRIDKYVKIN